MDQSYSAWADWLSKFHTWPESIQALWLIAVPATLLGMTWLTMRGLIEIVRVVRSGPETTDREGAAVTAIFPSSPLRHGRPRT